VDFNKAFDSISHDKLWVTMMDMGYPLHLTDLLAKMYRKQLAKVKVVGTLSEWFRVNKKSPTRLCPFSVLVQLLHAFLCGAPEATPDQLQRVRNNLVRVVCQHVGHADCRCPQLRSLHWLTARQQVTYKMAMASQSKMCDHSNTDVPQ